MGIGRRDFLFASGAFALLGGCRTFGVPAAFDEDISVFISDVHISPGKYHYARFEAIVAKILAMRPLPKRVVCFGDIAYLYGRHEDYVESKPLFDRLLAAGIDVTFGMGNHDRRGHFHEVWPDYAAREIVPGRIVSETSLGSCDLIMLDTLWEDHTDETRMCQVPGQLGGEQLEWLFDTMPVRKRPFFLAAHHPVSELKDGCDFVKVIDRIMDTPRCLGWIHGHNHVWQQSNLRHSKATWGCNKRKRQLGLPSTGHWGDIGYVTFRTSSGYAHADLVIDDHYFPNPSKRTWMDAEIVKEKHAASWSVRW